VEGEDAVSTNFAREPVLSYSCSGSRTLQLSSSTGLSGGASYYADYVFRVPETGTYELWYGGTPPGPRDDLYPSYASPFQIAFDGKKPILVSRETVSVVENYTPKYYWNMVGDVNMDARTHTIRFEVVEKRRFDGRYFFYLDCFFLVKMEGGKRVLGEPLPEVFPKDLDNRAIDSPFLSIEDYLIKIRDNPDNAQALINISLVYTMLGDYLGALKYLNRLSALKPDDAQALLLIAKNRIWKGDIDEGLKAYRRLLSMDPARRDLWMEAGKVAAWMGRYFDAISLFTDGLAAIPNDLDLTVNLGLSYLWASRQGEGEAALRSAQDIAGNDAALMDRLGTVYRVNGYPDRAISEFQAAIRASPRDLRSYLLLIEVYQSVGRTADADGVEKQISDTFFPSPRLTAYLDDFNAKQGMKQEVIAKYEAELAAQPDNLSLRQVLAQSYFWNGRQREAIEEYRGILANHAYIAIKDMEARSSILLQCMDQGYLAVDFLSRLPSIAEKEKAALAAELSRFKDALSARDAALKVADAPDAEIKLKGAEEALIAEAQALTARAEEARALTSQVQELLDLLSEQANGLPALQEGDDKGQQKFLDLIKENNWSWDKAGIVSELRDNIATDLLSRIVLAKIYLSDRQPSAAASLLSSISPDAGAGTGFRYTQVQTLLWGGKAADARVVIADLRANPGAVLLPSYFPEISQLAGRLSSPPEGAAAGAASDPAANAQAAAADLDFILRPAAAARKDAESMLAAMHALYSRGLVRAFYSFESNTVSMRNELGDYYVTQEDLQSAIAQFRKVLAIEPGDLEAQFRLGKICQWNRDWRAAMDAFKTVYSADPYYENVAALFNQVSRDHADSLDSTTSFFSDTSRVQWRMEASFTHLINSVFGLTAEYRTDQMRIDRIVDSFTDRSAYQVQDLSLGLPVDLYPVNLKITPRVGGCLMGNGLFTRLDSTVGTWPAPGDAFGLYSVEPYGQADVSLGIANALYLTSTLRYGRYAETFDPLRTPVYDGSVEANLAVPFSFINAWPLRDTSLRVYGKLDCLAGPALDFLNAIYTGVGELTVYLIKGGDPYTVITLIGNATYQDSYAYEPYQYYSPLSELTIGGSLMGSMWIGVGGGATLGVSLRAYGGAYQQRLLSGSPVLYWKLEGEADLTLTRGNSAWTLTGFYNTTIPESYWSFLVRFGCSIKLPTILAP
jgi:cytochrome c-type biogenesis protein CcmH/NrfG